MDRISVTLPSEMVSRLSDAVEESYDNRSEAVRDLLEKGFEHKQRITELEQEYKSYITELREQVEDLERESERLQNEKRLILEQREEHTELVEYVEEERDSNRRDRERRQAPAWRRAKWWLLGEPDRLERLIDAEAGEGADTYDPDAAGTHYDDVNLHELDKRTRQYDRYLVCQNLDLDPDRNLHMNVVRDAIRQDVGDAPAKDDTFIREILDTLGFVPHLHNPSSGVYVSEARADEITDQDTDTDSSDTSGVRGPPADRRH